MSAATSRPSISDPSMRTGAASTTCSRRSSAKSARTEETRRAGAAACLIRLRQTVEIDRVQAEDPLLRGVGQADHLLAQLADDARDLRVGVRVVARPDDPVGADQRALGGELQRALVGVERDPALALEVLRRLHRELRYFPAEDLVVVIEPLEDRHDPAAVRLQEDAAQARESLEHAAADQ